MVGGSRIPRDRAHFPEYRVACRPSGVRWLSPIMIESVVDGWLAIRLDAAGQARLFG